MKLKAALIILFFMLLVWSSSIQVGLLSTSYADSSNLVSNVAIQMRGEAYAANNIANQFLRSLDSSENMELRGQLLGEAGRGTGQPIPLNLRADTQAYMSQVNLRSTFSREGATVVVENGGTSSTWASESKPPNPSELTDELDKVEVTRTTQTRDLTRRWTENFNPQMDELLKQKEAFQQAGLGSLYSDIQEYELDGGANPKQRRNILRQMAQNQEAIERMGNETASSLARASGATMNSIERVQEKARKAAAEAESSFQQRQQEFESGRQGPPKEGTAASQQKLREKQAQLDEQFFKKRNLNPVKSLSDLTADEHAAMLGDKQTKALVTARDPSKAIAHINLQRQKKREFIQTVSNFANETTRSAVSGKPPRVPQSLQSQSQKMASGVEPKKLTRNYQQMVDYQLSRYKNTPLSELADNRATTNIQSKVAILDGLSDNGIDPRIQVSGSIGRQQIDRFGKTSSGQINLSQSQIKQVLDNIPSGDSKTRRAFIQSLVESGTDEQVRALKIYAPTETATVYSQKQMQEIRCKKGGGRW